MKMPLPIPHCWFALILLDFIAKTISNRGHSNDMNLPAVGSQRTVVNGGMT